MARPLTFHRGQRKPWGSIPRINWDHPLARGLVSYGYDAGSGPIDLVTGGQRSLGNTGAPFGGPKSSKYGSGLTSVASSSVTLGLYNLPGGSVIEGLTVAAPYSFSCGLMLTATPTFQSFVQLFSTCDATFNTPVLCGAAYNDTTDYFFEFANTAVQPTAIGLVKINQYQTLTGVALTSSTAACYVDGALSLSPTATTTLATMSGARPAFHGLRNTANQFLASGFIYYGALWKGRALTAAEARLLHDDPYCFLIYPEDEVLDTVVGVTVAVSTGDLAVTEALDTALFNGGPVISAALAVTEALDTALFAGGPVISAALAVTEAIDTALFNGSVVVSGTLATTEAIDVAAFAGGGAAEITGTLAVTEAKDIAVFAGSVGVSGALTTTEAKDVAVFAGFVGVSGTLAVTEAKDVAAFAGSVLISGTLSVTEAKDVAAFAVAVNFTSGSLVANEAGVGITNNTFPAFSAIGTTVVGDLFVTGIDTAAFTGFAGVFGGLTVTEAKDVASFTGTLPAVITGTLVVNEAGVSLTSTQFPANSAVNTIIGTLSVVGIDTAIFNGAVGVNGTLATTETKDTALFNGQVIPIGITGTLTVTEARDVAAFNAVLAGASGTLAVTEAKDTAVFAATTVITGTLTAIETVPDTATFNGKVGVSGSLGTTEAIDTALFNGYIGIAGLLAATEARDVAAFTGSVIVSGTLVATDAPDTAAFIGHLIPMPELFGILSVTEATDTAAFNGLLELFGTLSAIEAGDIAFFDARAVEEEAPADFENWKFGKRFDRSLTSRFPWQG